MSSFSDRLRATWAAMTDVQRQGLHERLNYRAHLCALTPIVLDALDTKDERTAGRVLAEVDGWIDRMLQHSWNTSFT